MGHNTHVLPKRDLLLEEGMKFQVFPFGFRQFLGISTLSPHLHVVANAIE